MPESLTSKIEKTIYIVPHKFFNEFEKNLEDQILNEGTGYYRCVQLLSGAFISVEKVTEITEEVYETFNDRLVAITDEHRIFYIYATTEVPETT